ncbi:hypothetical protein I4F81_005440 [Pyropia yezoensis]|uniref:Uncharacterized protein n=1 Tax=Pyropia yezoensis TaxID=2788 RepID=A0ACC3BZ36_PYRYE|nr:hypothetical protein I4F81_005440 [Neopyropia yezoensis]
MGARGRGRARGGGVSASRKRKYFAVSRGRDGASGVFDNWEACRQLVEGVPGARFKSFPNRLAAAASAANGGGHADSWEERDDRGRRPPVLVICTDGAWVAGRGAGVGVYFGPDDARNVSERLTGDTQTAQRAGLTARNGWVTPSGEAVKNEDLWRSLDELLAQERSRRSVEIVWVRRGVVDRSGNEAADRLATEAIQREEE